VNNIESYKYRDLLELRESYFNGIEYDEKSKGYKDPKFPTVLLKRK